MCVGGVGGGGGRGGEGGKGGVCGGGITSYTRHSMDMRAE